MNETKKINIQEELDFQFSRSSGAGGQHVNKTESKVELRFDVGASMVLTDKEKQKLFLKLKNRINSDGVLTLSSQFSRSQLQNKKIVVARFYELLGHALVAEKKRIPTRPSKKSVERRIEHKKQQAGKKMWRRKIDT